MKTIFYSLLAFFVGAMGIYSSDVYAAKQTPMQLLKKTQKKVEKIIDAKLKPNDTKAKKEREEKVQELIEPFFDFELLAEKTLTTHWKTLSAEQKKKFTFWFKELLKQAYISGTRTGEDQRDKQKYELKYTKEEINGNNAKVFTLIRYQVTRRGRKRWKRVHVDWAFLKLKDRWKVMDILTNDNSLISTYQENFDKIIRKNSFATLLDKIQKKVRELRKKHGLPALAMKSENPPKK